MPEPTSSSVGRGSGVLRATSAGSPATVLRAVEFIEVHASREIGLVEIAAAARLGTRALQLAFRAHHDVTPLEYLRRVRMARAHADLQQADPTFGATVGAVATRWMFTNPGRFAGQYREIYGSSPGGTLRAGPPTADDETSESRTCALRWAVDPASDTPEAGAARIGSATTSVPDGTTALPDLDAALVALGIDPDDPADADDLAAVAAVWSRRAPGPVVGPAAPGGRNGAVLRLSVPGPTPADEFVTCSGS